MKNEFDIPFVFQAFLEHGDAPAAPASRLVHFRSGSYWFVSISFN